MFPKATLAIAIAVTVSGCNAFLPAAGPSTSAVVDGADQTTSEGTFARYEFIDVNAAVVEALRGRPLDSLLSSFGDGRMPSEAVIGIGDAVAVSVFEAGSGGLYSGPLTVNSMSAGSKAAQLPEQVVSRDGAISVPYAGRIKVAGRRAQDVQSLIETELAGKAIQPQVIVTVSRPVSQSVTVGGEAVGGARVPLGTQGDRILDVIATAGGVRAPVSETFVRLSRNGRTATVPLTTVVSNPKENIYLRPNDNLTLVRDPQTFLAIGALGSSNEIPFQAEGITLAQALAKARGQSDADADPTGTFLFRFEPAPVVRRLKPGSPLLGTPLVPVVYRFDMRDPNSLFLTQAFRMRNRDMVYVSNAPFTEIKKILSVFAAAAQPITTGARVGGAF
ncbi:polysaccharide biosynthesis/export family protein [Methylobacterium sp. WCS2018Hpa-22]|uniref:polysaccharide biosynthesis/export family protein n=1 Tax=Methylobacterium sp. WCS2018Hpa-22 TaxID=3073633 RepID=UPI002889ECD5|nr:polysaccharide biosynthesis/export family protein [Methylobacterium sp. WCS2018Hpa-22]